MFASRSVSMHLLRGIAGFGLIALGASRSAESPLLGTGLVLLALVPLRGCPICWTIGLFETLRGGLRRESIAPPPSSRHS